MRLDSGDGKQFISCSSTYDKGRGGRIAIIRPAGSGAGAKGEQFELDRRDIRDPALVLTSAILILAPPAVDRDAMIAPPPAVVIALPPAMPPPPAPYFQVVIEQQLIIRVPARRSPLTNFSAPPAPQARVREMPTEWKEKKAPKCVAMRNIMGMQAVQRDSIDLITRQNQRLRAQLNRGCRALDFYAGFYMKGNKDGRLCEDRDEIHARSGARCEIDKFRLLVPVSHEDD